MFTLIMEFTSDKFVSNILQINLSLVSINFIKCSSAFVPKRSRTYFRYTVSLYWQFIVDNKNAENKQVWNQQLGKEYNVDERLRTMMTSVYIEVHASTSQKIKKY